MSYVNRRYIQPVSSRTNKVPNQNPFYRAFRSFLNPPTSASSQLLDDYGIDYNKISTYDFTKAKELKAVSKIYEYNQLINRMFVFSNIPSYNKEMEIIKHGTTEVDSASLRPFFVQFDEDLMCWVARSTTGSYNPEHGNRKNMILIDKGVYRTLSSCAQPKYDIYGNELDTFISGNQIVLITPDLLFEIDAVYKDFVSETQHNYENSTLKFLNEKIFLDKSDENSIYNLTVCQPYHNWFIEKKNENEITTEEFISGPMQILFHVLVHEFSNCNHASYIDKAISSLYKQNNNEDYVKYHNTIEKYDRLMGKAVTIMSSYLNLKKLCDLQAVASLRQTNEKVDQYVDSLNAKGFLVVNQKENIARDFLKKEDLGDYNSRFQDIINFLEQTIVLDGDQKGKVVYEICDLANELLEFFKENGRGLLSHKFDMVTANILFDKMDDPVFANDMLEKLNHGVETYWTKYKESQTIRKRTIAKTPTIVENKKVDIEQNFLAFVKEWKTIPRTNEFKFFKKYMDESTQGRISNISNIIFCEDEEPISQFKKKVFTSIDEFTDCFNTLSSINNAIYEAFGENVIEIINNWKSLTSMKYNDLKKIANRYLAMDDKGKENFPQGKVPSMLYSLLSSDEYSGFLKHISVVAEQNEEIDGSLLDIFEIYNDYLQETDFKLGQAIVFDEIAQIEDIIKNQESIKFESDFEKALYDILPDRTDDCENYVKSVFSDYYNKHEKFQLADLLKKIDNTKTEVLKLVQDKKDIAHMIHSLDSKYQCIANLKYKNSIDDYYSWNKEQIENNKSTLKLPSEDAFKSIVSVFNAYGFKPTIDEIFDNTEGLSSESQILEVVDNNLNDATNRLNAYNLFMAKVDSIIVNHSKYNIKRLYTFSQMLYDQVKNCFNDSQHIFITQTRKEMKSEMASIANTTYEVLSKKYINYFSSKKTDENKYPDYPVFSIEEDSTIYSELLNSIFLDLTVVLEKNNYELCLELDNEMNSIINEIDQRISLFDTKASAATICGVRAVSLQRLHDKDIAPYLSYENNRRIPAFYKQVIDTAIEDFLNTTSTSVDPF